MKLHFDKMHGAGNDFVIADNSAGNWPSEAAFIRSVCDRHKGIGADGLILISRDPGSDELHMRYYNSDGSHAAMCGNGLRCAAAFVYRHKLADGRKKVRLLGDDGPHDTEIIDELGTEVKISLDILEPFQAVRLDSGETVYKGVVGVPHAIAVRKDVEQTDVRREGAFLR